MGQLAEQFRPAEWADVAGQDAAVRAIRAVLGRGWGGRAWWLVGASGTGKTTLAKLIAAEGASELATEEHDAGSLTPAKVRELERQYQIRPLPINGKCGWAILVNECHGLRRDTVRALLDVLERLPGHVCWLFTTTNAGQASFFDDDQSGDAAPLVSRCQEIRLATGPAVWSALAKRARWVARQTGCDGMPDCVYERAVAACKGNLRMVLQRVESGQLAAEALSVLEAEYAMVKATKGEHGAKRRAELEAAIKAAKGGAA
jgi:replication-associated recombination protein RarA